MDYERQIDKAIIEYEDFKPYKTHSIDWICNRIDWCWKWRKISESAMSNFSDRIVKVMEEYR